MTVVLDQFQGYGIHETKYGYGTNKRNILIKELQQNAIVELPERQFIEGKLDRWNEFSNLRLWHGGQGSIKQPLLTGIFNGGGNLNIGQAVSPQNPTLVPMEQYYWKLRTEEKFPVLKNIWRVGSFPNNQPEGTFG